MQVLSGTHNATARWCVILIYLDICLVSREIGPNLLASSLNPPRSSLIVHNLPIFTSFYPKIVYFALFLAIFRLFRPIFIEKACIFSKNRARDSKNRARKRCTEDAKGFREGVTCSIQWHII